ncbi:MAG: FtsX-like permease family protein, partial [Brevibacterium sp.]|nr:FtsX-like permease family protein [Brevibacterium sp.]
MNILPVVLTKESFTSTTSKLVAIAFFACSTLFLTVAGGAWAFNDRPEVSGYAEVGDLYRMLAILATVFLIVPAISLGVASAKLSARRQDERLSTLSLLGAKPGTVRLLAVDEPFIPAAVGILAGIAGYFLLAYPLSFLVFTGEPLGYSALLMPWWLLAAVVLGLLVVCLFAALLGLRKITVSPLGVRTRSLARKFPVARVIAVVVLVAGMIGALVFSLDRNQPTMVFVVASIITIG